MALVVLVEYVPPSDHDALGWLRHSPWLGVRPADFVFPLFLFLVGSSMEVSRPRPARLAKRTIALLLLGLLFNSWGDSGADLATLRLTGVLQMIAIAGFLAALVVLAAPRVPTIAGVVAALLVVDGAFVAMRPLEPGRTVAWSVDGRLFGLSHLYRQGTAGHDPEGMVATCLGGVALVLLGWMVARLLYRTTGWRPISSTAAALAVATAGAWSIWAPSKRLWTPTFTLLTALVAAAIVVAAAVLLDRRRHLGPVVWLFTALGRNAILIYLGQHLVLKSLENTQTNGRPLRDELLAHLGSSDMDLFLYAAAAVVVWSAIAAALHAVDWHVSI